MKSPRTRRTNQAKRDRTFDDWPIDDLRHLKTERKVDEEGAEYFMIFSKKMDALTAINAKTLAALKVRGLAEITDLPQ